MGKNCTKTKLHWVIKLHEDKIEQRYNVARRYFLTKTNLHELTKIHEDIFA